MILEHLTLRNFCLFRGQQIFDLTPTPVPQGDLEQGLREMRRAVQPGGRVVVLEITTPRRPPLSTCSPCRAASSTAAT